MKSGESATILFFILILITMIFQFLMYWERSRFVKALEEKKQSNFKKVEEKLSRFENLIKIYFPINLDKTDDIVLIEIRSAANNYRKIWMYCLILAFAVPFFIYKVINLL